MKIIFATGNKNKMIEIRQILQDLGMEILSMKEAGIAIDIVEDGKSFEENAMIKASEIAELPEVKAMDAIVLADDSGLEIDYLNKEPGIYSARYAGTDTSYDIKNNLLISRLKNVPDEQRTARFVCAIAAVFPNGEKSKVRKTKEEVEEQTAAPKMTEQERKALMETLTAQMKEAAKLLEFEHAAYLRDKIQELRGKKA